MVEPGTTRRQPHPFFFAFTVATGTALIAGVAAPQRSPPVALYDSTVYGIEVGLVVFVVLYLIAQAGWLAWHGRGFRSYQAPGGVGVERETEELDQAATEIGRFHEETGGRLDAIEALLEDVLGRVEALERADPGHSLDRAG